MLSLFTLAGHSHFWLLSSCSKPHSFSAQNWLMGGICAVAISKLEVEQVIRIESTCVEES